MNRHYPLLWTVVLATLFVGLACAPEPRPAPAAPLGAAAASRPAPDATRGPATASTRPGATPIPPPSPTATPVPPSPTPVLPTETPAPTATPPPAEPRLEQFRAFWVDAFRDGIKTPAQVDQLLETVRAANANAVVVQVRRRGDAYYNRTFEPRAEDPALQPGFDALQDLIEKAHRLDPPVEVHAWLATLPVWRGRGPGPADPRHVFNQHGPGATGREDWLARNAAGEAFDGTNYALDPGHPDALRYTVDVYLNVVREYDVDGIHFDYVRYADRDWGYNPTSLERFRRQTGAPGVPDPADPAWSQWRRDQVTALVRQIYLRTIALKPHVEVSAALIAWGDGPRGDGDWTSSAAYARTFQDWRAWLAEGILDLAIPMAYFREERNADWFDRWLDFFRANRHGRQIAVGTGSFLNDLAASVSQTRRALQPSAAGRTDGVVFYAYAQQERDREQPGLDLARALTSDGDDAPFKEPAVPPSMLWKSTPATGHLMGFATAADGSPLDGATLSIAGPRDATVRADGTGFYGFVDLPPGEYRVVASLDGREVARSVARIEAGRVAQLDLSAP